MAKSFFVLKAKSNDGYYDDHAKYHAMVYNDPYEICFCETYDDAKKMLVKESHKVREFDWMELVYCREDDTNIVKRYAEYDKRHNRYTEGFEVAWWITEIEFTKP